VLRRMPASGTVFLLGFFAITAAPPSALFVSELTIVDGAFGGGHYLVGALFLAILAVVFLGMATVVVRLVQGSPPAVEGFRVGEEPLTVAPAALFLILVVALGLYIPPELAAALDDAARYLESP
jgi:hydrogenase-4 component F